MRRSELRNELACGHALSGTGFPQAGHSEIRPAVGNHAIAAYVVSLDSLRRLHGFVLFERGPEDWGIHKMEERPSFTQFHARRNRAISGVMTFKTPDLPPTMEYDLETDSITFGKDKYSLAAEGNILFIDREHPGSAMAPLRFGGCLSLDPWIDAIDRALAMPAVRQFVFP